MNTLILMFSVTDFLDKNAILNTDQLEKVSGGKSDGSGAGFGERDVDLSFKTKEAMLEGKKKLKEYLDKHKIDHELLNRIR